MSLSSSTVVPAAAPGRLGREERAAISGAIDAVVASGHWVLGPAVEKFEADFAQYVGAGTLVGVGNGTDALALAFAALDLPLGAGVLLASNEGGFAASALRQVGLVPVVMDIDETTMAPTPALAEAANRPGVVAIVVTHLHGEAVPLAQLDAWRRHRGIMLVEDCSQAHGARLAGAHVGLVGDAAVFSFYPTKNLGAIGDAGGVLFSDPSMANRARSLRQYGWGEKFRISLSRGRNSRLDELQAAVLSARLPFLDARNDRRRHIANRYRSALAASGVRLHGDALTTVAHHSVVITERRDELATRLGERGISTAVHYPFLLSEMPGLEVEGITTPTAALIRDRMLSLPCFPEMHESEIDLVIRGLEEFVSSG